MKENFNLFGFKLNTKKFAVTIIISIVILSLLIVVHKLLFTISWYGLIIGMGFVLGVLIASELAPIRKLSKDMPYELVWLVFPLAIVGARIFYVINSLHEFDGFIDMLKVWEGGLSIFGGIIGGLVGVLIYSKVRKINPVRVFDVVVPSLIFGQAVGRWGNFINQEVYGFEITNKAFQWFPFGVNINGTWHLATFFYESVLNLIGFFILLKVLRNKKNGVGIPTFTYLTIYGAVRLFLEFLRVEKFILVIPYTNIPFSAFMSGVILVIGLAGLVTNYFKSKRDSLG